MNRTCLCQFFYDSPLNAVTRVMYNHAPTSFQMAIEAIHDRAKMTFECDATQWALAVYNEGKKTCEVLTANHLEVAKSCYHGRFEAKLISKMCSDDRLFMSVVKSLSLLGTFGAVLQAAKSVLKKEGAGTVALWSVPALIGIATQIWIIPKLR